MHQKVEEEKVLDQKDNRFPLHFVMQFYHEPSEDKRRSDPSCSEIAAVFETAYGAPPHRHISVYEKEGGLQKIDYDRMRCDPMCYTLIFPCGEPG